MRYLLPMATTEHPTVARAAKRAAQFAATARRDNTNVVTETTEDARLFDWMPLQRAYRVEVQDRTGRTTIASWTVALENCEGRRRSIRFHGWGFSAYSGGQRYTESMCRIRVTN